MAQALQAECEIASGQTGGVASPPGRVVVCGRTSRESLTARVRALLKASPQRRWAQSEVSAGLDDCTDAEASSVLIKMLDRGEVIRSRVHNGRRWVYVYKWRLPSDGAQTNPR